MVKVILSSTVKMKPDIRLLSVEEKAHMVSCSGTSESTYLAVKMSSAGQLTKFTGFWLSSVFLACLPPLNFSFSLSFSLFSPLFSSLFQLTASGYICM